MSSAPSPPDPSNADAFDADLISLPDGVPQAARAQLGLGPTEPLRLSFVAGFGDVVGTFRNWKAGQHDARVPVTTYSAQLYTLVRHLDAHAQIVTRFAGPAEQDPQFQFAQVQRQPTKGTLGYFMGELAYARAVTRAVREFDPHVVLAHSDFPAVGWPALSRGRTLILSIHNTYWPMGHTPSGAKAALRQSALRQFAKALDGAVCTSAECKRQVQRLTGGRVTGAVEFPQILSPYPSETRQRARRLLFLGRLEENKGIFLLLEAFRALKPNHPDLELTFAGSGAQGARLEAAIAEDPNGVRYLGQLGSEEVHQAIAQSDLLVCPTTTDFNEGLALVGLEAAAHGIPSVLSSVVPAADLLGAGCAVFRANETGDLIRCLETILGDDAVYTAHATATARVAQGLYDRSLSWGAQLGRLLAGMPVRG